MSTRNDSILDAAARCLQLTGRVSMAELARQAGVSRPTVYRRFADRDAVLRALWERELGQLLTGLRGAAGDRSALVKRIVRLADRISTHEALAPTFSSEPRLMTRYIADRLGTGQRALLDALRAEIARLQPGGTIRRGKPEQLAAMVLLIAQSAIQSRRMIAAVLPPAAWRRELGRALDGYLRP